MGDAQCGDVVWRQVVHARPVKQDGPTSGPKERPGLTAYLFAWVAMVPFAVLPNAYMGPLARKIGGVDVAGLVGLLIAGLTYRFFTRSFSLKHEQAAIAESNKELEDLVHGSD